MTEGSGPLVVRPVHGFPEVGRDADLGALIAAAATPADDEVVVIAQKVVSKAEGRIRSLATVEPGERAQTLAAALGKDPRLVELILRESRRVVRAERGVLIVETDSGWVCANAGIDGSNVPGPESVSLLPEDADASARRIRGEIERAAGSRPAVVIADSFGRPWRVGQAEVAIGCAGLVPLDDRRGAFDRDGSQLTATLVAIADQVAAAADLVRGKADGVPAAIIGGLERFVREDDGPGATVLRRESTEDLFR